MNLTAMVVTVPIVVAVETQPVHVVLAQRVQQRHKQIVLQQVVRTTVTTLPALATLVAVVADAQPVKSKIAMATVVQKHG
jgi:hypothetical protein